MIIDKDICPVCDKYALDFDILECDFCGSKFEICSACGGSGVYDDNGNPACDACSGIGLVRVYNGEEAK